jgi:hypothetical protein
MSQRSTKVNPEKSNRISLKPNIIENTNVTKKKLTYPNINTPTKVRSSKTSTITTTTTTNTTTTINNNNNKIYLKKQTDNQNLPQLASAPTTPRTIGLSPLQSLSDYSTTDDISIGSSSSNNYYYYKNLTSELQPRQKTTFYNFIKKYPLFLTSSVVLPIKNFDFNFKKTMN